jgi:hypothetical protein
MACLLCIPFFINTTRGLIVFAVSYLIGILSNSTPLVNEDSDTTPLLGRREDDSDSGGMCSCCSLC